VKHDGTVDAISTALFIFGYPVSIVIIVRWIPVVRERRIVWFWLEEAAVAAIVLGWILRERWGAVLINGTWLVVAGLWYWLAGRRARPRV